MYKMIDTLIKTVSTVSLIATSLILSASPAKAGELGGVNLDGFCRARYGSNARAYLIANQGASGWRCQVGKSRVSIDMKSACTWQHKRSDAVAQPLKWSDAYSWRCYGQSVLVR